MRAIVTGHSRGLGAALAEQLLACGIPVLGLARSANPELQRSYPRLFQHALDLGDQAALGAWLEAGTMARFIGDGDGALLLVNNAASAGPLGPAGLAGHAAVGASLALNVAAPLMLSEHLLSIARGRECRIMHISSGASVDPYPAWAAYCASKAALDQHARCLALEGQAHVRIASVMPGVIDTGMQAGLRGADPAFPLRELFGQLHANGLLQSPAACARRLTALLLDAQFGRDPVVALESGADRLSRPVPAQGTAAVLQPT